MQADVDLSNDPRWRRLWDRPWSCSACGETHQGLSELAFGKPEQWPGAEDKAPNSALDLAANFLSEDSCVLQGQHFFVRAVLELPILGGGGRRFGYGVWSRVSEVNASLTSSVLVQRHDIDKPTDSWPLRTLLF
jgi:hypothetical protein